jgi:predicted RecA/RadA family phage recombinase
MLATFIHRGDDIEHVPSEDIQAGAVVVQGTLVGVTVHPIPAGRLGALQLTGVFDCECDPVGPIECGHAAYWSAQTNRVVWSEVDGVYMGKTVRPHCHGETVVRVRLSQ